MSERFRVVAATGTTITVARNGPTIGGNDYIVIYGPRWRDRAARALRYWWLRLKRALR